MKKYFLLNALLVSGLIFSFLRPVYAQTLTLSPTKAVSVKQSAKLSNLKEKAIQEIDRRITSLNKLKTRISENKKMTSVQVTQFDTEIVTEVNNLESLKTKIDAETDMKNLQAYKKSIVDSYRIYALFMPKISLIIAANRVIETADKITALAKKYQDKLLQSSGNTDLETKLADAKTQANAVISEVSVLKPEGFPGNKQTLIGARSKLKTGTDDIKGAYADLKTLIPPVASSSPALEEKVISPTP